MSLRKAAARKRMKKPRGPWEEIDLSKQVAVPEGCTRAFMNNRYMVTVYDETQMTEGVTATKVMVQRWDDKPIPGHWAQMQRIKNELFGESVCAVEYYPPQGNLIDDKNIYWLFMFDGMPRYINW